MTLGSSTGPDRGGLLLDHVWFTAPVGYSHREGWERRLEELARKAQPEPWDDPYDPTGKWPVLSNFLRYSYARLLDEDGGSKLVEAIDDRGVRIAAFNTGLFTTHFEPLICFLEQHRDPDRQRWVFKDWMTLGDRRLGRLDRDRLRPAYFFEDPQELVYDPRLELVPNVEHILFDNDGRWPAGLPEDDVQRRIMLDGAIREAGKRAQMNWRLAVPQFYWPGGRHEGRIELLLPLRFHSSRAAELALVVERQGESYVGSTILTLSMAYKHARLVARPASDWLSVPPLPLPEAEEIDDDQAAPKWRRVSAGDRCPVCGEPTGCAIRADNLAFVCRRIEKGGKPIHTSTGEQFWEHTPW